ncbi:MAG TPA: hypothetical protein VIP53_10070 [Nitrososphaera sp.]
MSRGVEIDITLLTGVKSFCEDIRTGNRTKDINHQIMRALFSLASYNVPKGYVLNSSQIMMK